MTVTIKYFDGKTYIANIVDVSEDVITAEVLGEQKNFTRSLIKSIERGVVLKSGKMEDEQ